MGPNMKEVMAFIVLIVIMLSVAVSLKARAGELPDAQTCSSIK